MKKLSDVMGKKVKDVEGYWSNEFGEPTFKMTKIIFEDDTYLYA